MNRVDQSKSLPKAEDEAMATIVEIARVAYKAVSGEDAPVAMEITTSRGPWWCGIDDDTNASIEKELR